MKAFEVKTNVCHQPVLVIASGLKEAVEMVHLQGIRDKDIISVQQLEAYRDENILHEGEIKRREELRDEVTADIQKTLPRWRRMGNGAMGGSDRDVFLIRTARGHYRTSSCVCGSDVYYLELEALEQLPGLPNEEL